jgi:hypothetical protein
MSQYPENNPPPPAYGPGPAYPPRPAPPGPGPGYPPYPAQPEPHSGYGSGPYSNPYTPPSGPRTTPNPYTDPAMPPGPVTGPDPYNPYLPEDPYAPTMMSRNAPGAQGYTAYPGPRPTYPVPPGLHSTPPPAGSPSPRRRGRGVFVLLILLVVLLVAGGLSGLLAYNTHQNDIHATATATARAQSATRQARATATAQVLATATTIASTYPFSNRLVLNDSLTNDSHISQYGWDNDGTNCFFANGSYHTVSDQANYYYTCGAGRTSLTNFTFQVQMTIRQGGDSAEGGLIFRGIENNSQYYILFIDTQGNFSLDIAVNSKGANDRTLQQGLLTNFLTGLNQVNTLGIVAMGSQISLYVNQKKEFQVSDSTYPTGQIGFLASYGTSKTDVIYNNVRAWQL